MEMECKHNNCECDNTKPNDDPMSKQYDEILGGTYIGNNASEPVLTEFAKKAIEIKMQIHDEMEKPKEGASWKEIANADNKYIQKCKIAMKELQENWKGDENQSQESAPIAPRDNCCCFTCLKIAGKRIDFHPIKLPLPQQNILRYENSPNKVMILRNGNRRKSSTRGIGF